MYSRVLFIALGLVTAVGTAIVYSSAATSRSRARSRSGTVAAFVLYVEQIYQPLAQLTNSRVDVLTALVSFERVFEVLDFPRRDHRPARRGRRSSSRGAASSSTTCGSATRPAATCRWSRSRRRARPAPTSRATGSCATSRSSIEPGETVALVGPSGAGKTTIAMLVPRVYDIVQGAVRVDGHDVRDLTLDFAARRDRSRAAGPAPLPRHDPRQPAVRAPRRDRRRHRTGAASGARIWDLVASLPDGLDTVVGERGYRMSGGEKQRLAIARLLLEGPRDRDPRRSDVASRLRIRGRDPARVRRGAAGPHRDRDRAPAVDDRRRRPDRRRRRGAASSRPGPTPSSSPAAASTPTCTAPSSGRSGRTTSTTAMSRPARRRPNGTRAVPYVRIRDDSNAPFRDVRPWTRASRRERLAARRRTAVRVGRCRRRSRRGGDRRRRGIGAFAAYTAKDTAPAAGRRRHADGRRPSATGAARSPPRASPSTRRRARSTTPHPLRLWVGGDSLAGSFGPALGDQRRRDRRRADGHRLQGLERPVEQRHPQLVPARDRPDDDRRTPRPSCSSSARTTRRSSTRSTRTATASPTGSVDYRAKVDRMMDTFIGPNHRTVFWLGAADARHPESWTAARRRDRPGHARRGGEARARRRLRRHVQAVLDARRHVLAPHPRRERQRDHAPASPTACTSPNDGAAVPRPRGVHAPRRALAPAASRPTPRDPIGWTLAAGSGENVPGYSYRADVRATTRYDEPPADTTSASDDRARPPTHDPDRRRRDRRRPRSTVPHDVAAHAPPTRPRRRRPPPTTTHDHEPYAGCATPAQHRAARSASVSSAA